MKTIYNLIIIFIIGLFASTFPFTISPIDYKDSIVLDDPENKPSASLEIDGETNLYNPTTVVVQHIADSEIKISNLPQNIFSADIYQGDELIKGNITNIEDTTISFSDSEYIISNDNPLKSPINISQEKLGIKDGKYKIVLKSSLISDKNKNTTEIFVEYETDFIYKQATNQLENPRSMGIELYFTDKLGKAIVPVTRFVVRELPLNMQVIYELEKGPINTEMTIPIGRVNACIYNNGPLYMDIPSDDLIYSDGKTAHTAYDVLVNSMFAMSKYLNVTSIKINVDGKTQDEFFNGISIKNDILPDNSPKAYCGYKIGDRMYLFKSKIDGIEEINNPVEIANKIIDFYKNSIPEYAKSPIPENLKMNFVKLQNSILTVDFDDSFINGFDTIDEKNFMLDALLYSFESIPGVNGIKITVNGNSVNDFIENRDITGVLKAPIFINPEN